MTDASAPLEKPTDDRLQAETSERIRLEAELEQRRVEVADLKSLVKELTVEVERLRQASADWTLARDSDKHTKTIKTPFDDNINDKVFNSLFEPEYSNL